MTVAQSFDRQFEQALALHQQGDFAAAEAIYLQILAAMPDHFDARHLLGVIRLHQGRNFDALELIGTALKIQPKDARALSNFGMALTAFGRTQEALESYNKALALQPDFPEALLNRGLIFHDLKEYSKALKNFDKALALRRGYADAWFNRGNTLLDVGRFEEAVVSYQKALAADPARPPVLNNLGNALFELNRLDEAIANYDKALALAPDYADALNNRGRAFYNVKRYDEALAAFNRALARALNHVEALNNRGNVFRDLRRYQEAGADFERALALAPEHRYAFGGLADAALKICDWSRMASIGREMSLRINAKGSIVPPLTLLGYSSDPKLQLQCARGYIKHLAPAAASVPPKPFKRRPRPSGRLRVAYLSSDFFAHATAFLMAELFEIHDRSRVDVLGVSFGRDDSSDMRARLIAAFDEFHDVRMHSDREVADLIRKREVDIAVDLKGLTQDSRPGILSSRPAPLQVTYLGFPGTIGADFIDYVLADPKPIETPMAGAPNSTAARQRAQPLKLPAQHGAVEQLAKASEQPRQNPQRAAKSLKSRAGAQTIKLLLVCGPWGSGTTAVAGLLHRLGAVGIEPNFQTSDERTPNSYESRAFRELLLTLSNEDTVTANERADLRIASELEKFRDQLAVDTGAGRPIFLKHALSALFLPVICSVFDTRLIYVVRPLVDIETTRLRRAWPAQFGAKGADIIYSHMFRTFVDHAFPTTVIRYAELLEAPLQQARHLSEFAGLESSQRAIEHAAAFVTNPRSDRGKLG